MKPEVSRILRGTDSARWKEVGVEYGNRVLSIRVPENSTVPEMKEHPALPDLKAAIEASLRQPIGTQTLPDILKGKGKPADRLTVCIATSDITRPVPYKGESGILPPLLEALHRAGVNKVIRKIGEDGILYCSPILTEEEQEIVPGGMGRDFLPARGYKEDDEKAREMVQNAVLFAVNHPKWGGALPSFAFLAEGPYAVPVLKSAPAAT